MAKFLCVALIVLSIKCCSSQSTEKPNPVLEEVAEAIRNIQRNALNPRNIANQVLREIRDQFTKVQWDIQRGAFQMYDVALRWRVFQDSKNRNTTSCSNIFNDRLQREMLNIIDRARDDCYFSASQTIDSSLDRYEIPSAGGMMEDIKVMYGICAGEEPCMEMTRSYGLMRVQEYKMLLDNVGMVSLRDVRQQATTSTVCLSGAVSNALRTANVVLKDIKGCMENVVKGSPSSKPVPA